jgi:1-acyl-sn-glycerol-3-phosphate acyltransferase
MRGALLSPIEALFRVLFEYDCFGEEHVPPEGPAVVAANHPSYLDPVLLSLQVRRPIRFMAWDRLFAVPLLGAVIRALGAFPVDTRKGQGRTAYEQAKALVLAGDVVGIFPEGRRSTTGWMEPALREGAARLAYETGAPLVPATITGAFRAWPHFKLLPRPARIRVRFHPPIDSQAFRDLPEEAGIAALQAELRRRVERTLMPGVRADARRHALYAESAPWPRGHEYLPALCLALLVFWRTRSFAAAAPAYAYLLYLFVDLLVLPQRRLVKWIRNALPIYFTLGYGGFVLGRVGLPEPFAKAALLAIVSGAFFPYFYERRAKREGFIAGLVTAVLLEVALLLRVPSPLGAHVALPVFAAAYAWERRTVFWRYAAPVLIAYAVFVPRALGGGVELLPHVVAGLLAWMLVRFFSGGRRSEEAPAAAPAVMGLGLLDPPDPGSGPDARP